MAVPVVLSDLSVSEASNAPLDSESITPSTRPSDYMRTLGAFIRRMRAVGAPVASASTVNIGAITDGEYVHITGTTTITAFDTIAAGVKRTLVFDGILTLTHNATTLILPGAANITTAVGDVYEFTSEGSGNWRCTGFAITSGYQPLDAQLTTLAAITATQATDLAALSTFMGTVLNDADEATARATLGVINSKILQVVHVDTGAVATGTTVISINDTVPQITAGDQYMSLAITPISAASTLVITVTCLVSSSVIAGITAALFRDSGANSLGAMTTYLDAATAMIGLSFSVKVASGSVAATTFTARAGSDRAATTTFNGNSGARIFGGVMASSIRITEIAA